MIDDNIETCAPVLPRPSIKLPVNPIEKTAAILPFAPVAAGPRMAQPVTPEVTAESLAVDPKLVKLFEDLLRAATLGKITFAAVASVDYQGIAFSTWEPEDDMSPQQITQAMGAVGYLSHRFNQSCVEGADYDNTLVD